MRRPHFENFALEPELVSGPDWLRPADLAAGADDHDCRFERAFCQEAHRQRRRVPPARREAPKEGVACRLLVQVEGLRIERGSEGLDLLGIDLEPDPGPKT